MIIVEIAYAGAGEFGTLGAVSYLFALCTRADVAFRAEGYQLALAKTSLTLKILTLDFGLFRAQVFHEFFGFLVTFAPGVQVHRAGTAIKSTGRNQIFPVLGSLHGAKVLNLQAD
jgi:hypothetical protein